jgi:hypothetical protein
MAPKTLYRHPDPRNPEQYLKEITYVIMQQLSGIVSSP